MTGARTYKIYQQGSAMFMMMALLWLAVSAPFVFGNQENADSRYCWSAPSSFAGTEEENNNSPGNSTEEKIPKSLNSFTEEYLHGNHRSDHIASIYLQYVKNQDAGIYISYHGEPLVPPPNAA